ncbi:MAG: hypothetical protein WDM79_01985 [Terricaulis sp.]
MTLIQMLMARRTKTQVVWTAIDGDIVEYKLPAPHQEVLLGVKWGRAEEFGTPAFWKVQSDAHRKLNLYQSHRLGADLIEEVAACVLGGYGIPAELGLAAFARLRDDGLLSGDATAAELERALLSPFYVRGTQRSYRFARQKAKHLEQALRLVQRNAFAVSGRELRDQLLSLPGVGLKTASWIVRNHLNSDDVAILDVHVVRACAGMGLFPASASPQRNYYELEKLFLMFCSRLAEPASLVDALIWDYMRRVGYDKRSVLRARAA